MLLKFNVDMDDLVAFNQHFITTSPRYRANRIRSVVTLAVVFTCLAMFQSVLHKSFIPLVIWAIITTIFCICIYWKSGKVSVKKIRKLYSEDRDKLVLCDHQIENLQDGFVDRTPLGEQMTKLPAILRVDETPSHIFIFTGSMQAHIIPKGKVHLGNVREFVALLKDGNKSQPPASN